MASTKTGAYGPLKTADGEIQTIVNQVLPAVNAKTKKDYKGLVAIVHQSQVVNGTNHKVLVRIIPNNYLKLEIYVPLGPGAVPDLKGVQDVAL